VTVPSRRQQEFLKSGNADSTHQAIYTIMEITWQELRLKISDPNAGKGINSEM